VKEVIVTSLAGAFVWFEHISSDPARAQRFYSAVFSPGAAFSLGGLSGGARWVPHVSVDDLEPALQRVVAACGRIVSPAIHLPGVGRMARVADPQGTIFGLVTLDLRTDGDRRFAWNELWTPEPAGALAFYTSVLGHVATPVGQAGTYHFLRCAGAPRAGVLKAPLSRPGWLAYLRVAGCDEALARALRAGGRAEIAPVDVPGVGRLAIVRDPPGARLGLLEPAASWLGCDAELRTAASG
jgi:predicted enzyme related to lactoylglutathione lyase